MIHRRFRAGTAAFALLLACAAQARMKEVEPGETVALAADEGLLVVAVEAQVSFNHLRIKRNGALFDGGTLKQIPKGASARLFVVEAGRYRYDEVGIGLLRYDLGSDPEFGFDVQPGRINYPGHFIFTPTGWYTASFHVPNRGLLAIDWLEAKHPAIYAGHEFAYAGHYPDPFPAFYRETASPGTRVDTRSAPMPPAGALPMAVATLWESPAVQWADINDGGDLIAMAVRDDFAQQWNVQVVERATGKQYTAFSWSRAIDGIEWSGDRTLVLSLSNGYAKAAKIIRIGGGPPSSHLTFEALMFPRQGEVVSLLPDDPDALLYAVWDEHNGKRELQVHRVDISSQKALDGAPFRKRKAIDRGVSDELAWFADGHGRLRAALALRDGKLVVMHGADGEFRPVLTLDGDSAVRPLGLSADGGTIYAYTDQGRAQRELVEIDPATGKVGKTLFARAGADVQGAIFDHRHALVGARYYEGGQLVSAYFDDASEAVYRKVKSHFPDKQAHLVDRDARGAHYLVVIGASDQVGELHHYDVAADRTALLQDLSPWLDDKLLAPSTLVKARSADGFDLEAFLTIPRGARDKRPLVVLPHGGPIGVRDSRDYSPEVQFLASLGYAVLQVNFRGSEGYGTAFREAGKRSYGTRIEDDIDAVLAVALRDHPLDASRVCAVGTSYGGYSALMSAIRWPERFRCVVSMSGISDRPLFFTASDTGRHEAGRKLLERFIGDPRQDAEEMRRNSPLYRVKELRTPVMLVHGTEDVRVDYEHTRRLQRMLNLAGVTPVVVSMEGEGHGIEDAQIRRVVWEGVAGFLRQHLGDPVAAPAAP